MCGSRNGTQQFIGGAAFAWVPIPGHLQERQRRRNALDYSAAEAEVAGKPQCLEWEIELLERDATEQTWSHSGKLSCKLW